MNREQRRAANGKGQAAKGGANWQQKVSPATWAPDDEEYMKGMVGETYTVGPVLEDLLRLCTRDMVYAVSVLAYVTGRMGAFLTEGMSGRKLTDDEFHRLTDFFQAGAMTSIHRQMAEAVEILKRGEIPTPPPGPADGTGAAGQK